MAALQLSLAGCARHTAEAASNAASGRLLNSTGSAAGGNALVARGILRAAAAGNDYAGQGGRAQPAKLLEYCCTG